MPSAQREDFRVRACARCAGRAAERGGSRCWWCLNPGQVPPPCTSCGSPTYYCAGYCYPCHPHTLAARSCLGCLSWGEFAGRMCPACAALRRKHGLDRCTGCGRQAPLDRGFCRTCRHQATRNAQSATAGGKPNDNDRRRASRLGLQLFFAGMQRSLQLVRQSRPTVSADSASNAVLPTVLWPVPDRPVQMRLIDVPRDLRRARVADRPPVDPELSEHARHRVEELAVLRGWSTQTLERVRAGVTLMVAVHGRNEPVLASTVAQLAERRLPVALISAVLTDLGLLDDDRTDRQAAWTTEQLRGLPEPIHEEVTTWIEELRDGGPRARARTPGTLHVYLRTLQPFLLDCATRYQTLRQVTAADLQGWLKDNPTDRHLRASAARSLFRTLKKHRLIFADPTRGLPAFHRHLPIPTPLPAQTETEIGALAAVNVDTRLVVALVGVHALTNQEITTLLLDDVDLPGRRLSARGTDRPLDPFTAQAVTDYLDHRRRRWPGTANPHLLITRITCHTLASAHPSTVNRWLKGVVQPTQLRQSRLLDEADASGSDPLLLAHMFGISAQTSTRYTDAVDGPITD